VHRSFREQGEYGGTDVGPAAGSGAATAVPLLEAGAARATESWAARSGTAESWAAEGETGREAEATHEGLVRVMEASHDLLRSVADT
jgi:hypothetical protein